MTRDELEAKANEVLIQAKFTVELEGEIPPMFWLHYPAGWKLHRLPPGTEHLMGSGPAKRELFGWLRQTVRAARCDGAVFLTDTWAAEPTEEGMKHTHDEWNRLTDQGFETLVKLGWFRRREALGVTAQSETHALIVAQPYQRRGSGVIEFLEQGKSREWFAQENFGGRGKMFGDLREENLGEHPDDQK